MRWLAEDIDKMFLKREISAEDYLAREWLRDKTEPHPLGAIVFISVFPALAALLINAWAMFN